MSNVLLSDISLSMKACLGSTDANPDMWLRMMLGGPMHEMGVEYTEEIAVLLKRISSRMWDRDISDIAVDRARQAVRDRTTLNWVTGRHIKNWYLLGNTGQTRNKRAVGASNKSHSRALEARYYASNCL